MMEQQRVYRIKDVDSLLGFLREDLYWDLPEASIDDVSFEWTGLDLNLSEDVNKRLKDGLIRQLQPFATHQPWGIFVVEFVTREVSITTLRQILRCFVAKRRGARPDLPAWQCENLLFICLYGENGFTFAHFKGDNPYSSKLTTFSWHPGEPIRTVCEFNLPELVYDYTWTPETWVEEWQKAFDVEKVNKDFYKQIARFYYRLTGKEGQKRELVLPYVGDDSGSISIYEEFAVRLIGRSIFCWFLKHKKSANQVPVIPPEALSLAAARKTASFYHSMLEPILFEVMNKPRKDRKSLPIPRSEIIPFLNGGLFEPHPNDFYADAPNYGLKIPDTWFIDFFSLLERYNFTITENSSIDVDVAVDPEMLGRIFENLLAEAVPETGETARRATGSYYTPRVIVDYMVEQSLKQYLVTKTELGEEKVNRLVDYGEEIEDFSPEEKLAVVTAFREMKVIDPACGSGAFPMGILHRMLLVLEKVDPQLELWRKLYLSTYHPVMRRIIEDKLRRGNEQYIRKLAVIQDSIYGVDILPVAVEIAKLRCFLSLIVDEMVLDNEENRGIEPLPNLEFKFVAANTLIGLPSVAEQTAFGITEAVNRLKELREIYLRSFGEEKDQIEQEFRATQQRLFRESIEWALTDAQVRQLTDWDPFSYKPCNWFDPAWMFGVAGGFDIVIANPPYLKERDNKNVFEIINESEFGRKYHQGKMDFWYYFLHKAIDIVKEMGVISYITSRYWLNSSGAKKLINRIKGELTFVAFLDIGKLKVFDEVAGQHMVAVYQKTKNNLEFIYKKVANELSAVSEDRETDNVKISVLSNEDIFSENDEIILEKRNSKLLDTIKLGEIAAISQGVIEAPDKISARQMAKIRRGSYRVGQGVFVLTEEEVSSLGVNNIERHALKKYLDPNDIGKYCIRFRNKYLIYSDSKIREKIRTDRDYSHIKTHLDHFNCFITSSNRPYGIHRARERKYFDSPKIIFKNMFVNVGFSYDDNDHYYFGFSFSSIIQKNKEYSSKYILAILNSMFAQDWFYANGKRRGAGVDIGVEKLRSFPIKDIAFENQLPFVKLVDQILAVTKDEDYLFNPAKQSKVKELERRIDQMVYELYGLTPDEIAVVEGRSDE